MVSDTFRPPERYLGLVAFQWLEVQDFIDALSSEDVVASLYSLIESSADKSFARSLNRIFASLRAERTISSSFCILAMP